LEDKSWDEIVEKKKALTQRKEKLASEITLLND